MLSIVANIYRNILSAHCSIKCNLQNSTISTIKVTCTKTYLLVSFLNDSELLHSVKILTPKNFFIPSSVLIKDNEKIELGNDILTITRNCPELKITNSALQLQYSVNESTDNSGENISDTNCDEHVNFNSINNICSDIVNRSYLDAENNVEINFRIQILNGDLITACSSKSPSVSSFSDFFKTQIRFNEQYEVFCTNCRTQLFKTPVTFENLLVYNSMLENLSEGYFCHSKVLPASEFRKKTLYVGVEGLYLHREIIDSFPVKEVMENILFPQSTSVENFAKNSEIASKNNEVEKFIGDEKCKTCNIVLTKFFRSGTFSENFKLFYPEAIMFKKPDSKLCNSEEYLRKIVMLALWTMICKSYDAVCKIIFECKCTRSGSVETLLLFIPPTKMAQFKHQSTLLASPPEINFTTCEVFKVLFHIGKLKSPHVYAWQRDFHTDFYEVGTSFFNTLKKILISSTKTMNSDTTVHEDFMTGCLSFNNLDLL